MTQMATITTLLSSVTCTQLEKDMDLVCDANFIFYYCFSQTKKARIIVSDSYEGPQRRVFCEVGGGIIDHSHKSHNAPVSWHTTMEQFCSQWYNVEYGAAALWNLWTWSIHNCRGKFQCKIHVFGYRYFQYMIIRSRDRIIFMIKMPMLIARPFCIETALTFFPGMSCFDSLACVDRL